MPLAEKKIRMGIRNGLHLRPAQQFVDLALKFDSRITIINSDRDRKADGKSIFEVITLAAEYGADLHLSANGDDANEAAETLAAFLLGLKDN